jgi:anti-sigma B factor antagonist
MGFDPDEIFTMTEQREGETVVVALAGELDLSSVGDVQRRLDGLRAQGQPVVLDLDRLSFLDSTGIRLLLRAHEAALREGWSFHVTRGSESVRRVLSAAHVIDRLPYAERARR